MRLFRGNPGCALLAGLVLASEAPASLPPEVLANNARGATVLVKNLEGRKSIGTGFFIYPDLLVTNKHVLESLEVEIVDEQGRTQIGRCVAEAKDDDLALVRAMTSGGYLGLRPGEPKYGEKIFIMGNPRGLQYTLSDGIVSHPVKRFPQGVLFQHSAPQSPGSSGSAVLDPGGRVIGVVCSQITDSQNLNFAVPVSRLKDLLQKWRLGMARPEKKKPVSPGECKPGSGGGGGGGWRWPSFPAQRAGGRNQRPARESPGSLQKRGAGSRGRDLRADHPELSRAARGLCRDRRGSGGTKAFP